MSSKRKAKGAASAAPTSPEPALIVTATVTVIPTDDQGADIHITVGCEGAKALVAVMRRENPRLQAAGAILRQVVMDALSLRMDGPPVDLLAERQRAGRA